MKNTQAFIEKNKDRFLNELFDLIRIPSVSADPAYKDDVRATAHKVKEHLESLGCDLIEVHETKGHPIVYAEKMINPAAPTVLVYGHYDVQPPDPMDLWETAPFEPTIRKTELHPDGAIYARGSCDDKGQAFIQIKAVEAMLAAGELPCNVKFMVEGEEEVGSPNLSIFCKENVEKLKCDVILVSDTSMIANDVPSITTGLRGLAYMEVEVSGPNIDLHSGTFGGGVANPINILSRMIASLHDENEKITIPGFYDDVEIVSTEERAAMAEAPFDETAYKKSLNIDEVWGEAGYSTSERTSIRPTLDCNGIWGGYTGEGAKTVLPAKAYAKISMRLVPHQKWEKISALFKSHFEKIAPPYVKVNVTALHGGEGSVTPTNTIEYKAAEMAYEKTFGKKPIPQRAGGSIPIVALFEEVLGAKTILMGFGLNSDAIHSPNEHFGLFNFYKGIETVPYFYQYYADLKKNA